MKSWRHPIGLALLAISSYVAAEGQCPSGYYPSADSDKGVINCLPRSTSMEPSRPANGPHWEGRWGAIAMDFGLSNVGVGASVAATSRRKAKSEALASCRAKGGQDCRINLIYDNQCAVVIAAVGYSRSHGGDTIEIAAERGLEMCRAKGFDDCQIYYKACSLPVQVQ